MCSWDWGKKRGRKSKKVKARCRFPTGRQKTRMIRNKRKEWTNSNFWRSLGKKLHGKGGNQKNGKRARGVWDRESRAHGSLWKNQKVKMECVWGRDKRKRPLRSRPGGVGTAPFREKDEVKKGRDAWNMRKPRRPRARGWSIPPGWCESEL